MRSIAISEKVKTNFGSVFVHLDCTPDGRLLGVAFSVPGKLDNSTIGDTLDALSATIARMTREVLTINEAFQPEEQPIGEG